jgi:hypothetical protein
LRDLRTESVPIVCTLGAEDFKDRVAWIANLNASALLKIRRDDLRLELTYAPSAKEDVLQMVRGEKACCSFLTFEMQDEPQSIRVIIEAPEEAREAAELVFAPFQSKTAKQAGCACCGAKL